MAEKRFFGTSITSMVMGCYVEENILIYNFKCLISAFKTLHNVTRTITISRMDADRRRWRYVRFTITIFHLYQYMCMHPRPFLHSTVMDLDTHLPNLLHSRFRRALTGVADRSLPEGNGRLRQTIY